MKRTLAASAVLFIGALFYFVRPTDPVAVSWAEHAGLPGLAHLAHDLRALAWAHAPVPGWLRGSASDFAYALAMGIVFTGASRPMLLVGLVAALGHELGQGLGWFTGTFDVMDLIVLAIGYAIGVVAFSPRFQPDLTMRNAGRRPDTFASNASASMKRSRPETFAS